MTKETCPYVEKCGACHMGKTSYEEEVPYALSNSLGFGGHNASILIGKYNG